VQLKKNAKFEVLRQNETEDGYLDLTGYISKADYVMEYVDWWEEKVNREFIPLEELQKAMNQAKGLILTDTHPWEFLNAKNATEHTNGFVTEVHGIEDKKLKVDMRVINSDLINDIRSNAKSEFSIGYFCELVDESGIIDGQSYDSKQVNLQLNHVAAVPNGRAGSDTSVITMNSYDKVSIEKGLYRINKKDNEEGNMKLRYNGKDYDANELLAELNVRDAKLTEVTNSRDTLDGKVAGLEVEKKDLETKVNSFEETFETEVSERINTISVVAELTGKETKDLSKMNSLDLKKEVINKAYEDMDLEDKTEAYIDGLYAGAVNKINSSDPIVTEGTDKKEVKTNGADRLKAAVNGIGGVK